MALIKKVITFVFNDLKHIFGDKMLLIFLLAPVFLLFFVNTVVPIITEKLPLIRDYHLYIVMFGGMQTSVMLGFISSFIILEEKDEKVLDVIRVLPITASFFLFYRLTFSAIFSFAGSLFVIKFNGLIEVSLLHSLLLSLQFSLIAPFITLIIATFAENKMEGLAYFKGVNLILLVPILAFFVPESYKYFFGIFPVFWSFLLFETCVTQGNTFLVFAVGMLVYGLVILFLSNRFIKLVFDNQ